MTRDEFFKMFEDKFGRPDAQGYCGMLRFIRYGTVTISAANGLAYGMSGNQGFKLEYEGSTNPEHERWLPMGPGGMQGSIDFAMGAVADVKNDKV